MTVRRKAPSESGDFIAVDLTDNQLIEALPLVRTIWPCVTPDMWRCFAGSPTERAGGRAPTIVGLFDAAGVQCGLFAYRLDRRGEEGTIFVISLFSAVDVANSLAPVRALFDAVEDRARRHGCARVTIRLGSDQSGLARRLRDLDLSGSPLAVAIIDERTATVFEPPSPRRGAKHDFNNLITVVLGNLAMLRSHLLDPEHRDMAMAAHEAAGLLAVHHQPSR